MTSSSAKPLRIDEAAFGVVYGSITVMTLLSITYHRLEAPSQQAHVLSGTIDVVAIVKAQAEVSDTVLKPGQPRY